MPMHQFSLALIPHKVQDSIVEQRAADGYVNATAMCKAAGKFFGHYRENDTTKAFLAALEADIGIPISKLIQVLRGANVVQGTWVHPRVAINLAQWLSPQFAVMVTKWVMDWMSGKGQPTKLPYHLERHVLNVNKVPANRFSVLQEMATFLLGPMESYGYQLRKDLMPDISQAKMLCKVLRDRTGIDTKKLEKYTHTFPDGREVQANLYPIEHLPLFRTLMHEEWLPKMAAPYFKQRDPAALLALDKMLLIEGAPPVANKPRFKRKA